MLAMMWGKKNHRSLLVGLQTFAAALEISVNSQRGKSRYDPAIPLLDTCPEDSIFYSADTCSGMLSATVFIVFRKWKININILQLNGY